MRYFTLNSLVSGGLKAFQGDFTAQDQPVQLIQDRKLLIGKSTLERLINQIMLHLRPGMHQNGRHLDFQAHRGIFIRLLSRESSFMEAR